MPTQTANYKWTKPDVGGSASTWGTNLNADLDSIDNQVWQNQQAASLGGCPIGSITMFGGATAPGNWTLCDGSSQSTTGVMAALFNVIGYRFGGSGANFNLPNLEGRFVLGAAAANPLGTTGGSYSYPITVANLPPHAHPITDVQHNHVLNQTPHGHADAGHTHGVNDPQHSHTLPGSLGGGIGAVSPPTVYNTAGGTVPTTNPASTGISIQSGNASIQPQNANLALNPANTGLTTTQNTGSGTPLNIVPIYVAFNFIIRYV